MLIDGPFHADWNWQLIWMLLYNGPLATAFAFWASVSLQRALPSSTISLSYLAVPAWGLIASTLWLGESLPASLIAGGVLIFLGVAAIAYGDARRAALNPVRLLVIRLILASGEGLRILSA